MLKYLYTVFDAVAQLHGNPFTCQSDREAVRSFRIAVNDPNTAIFQSPSDYSLWRLATFEDEEGSVELSKDMLVVALSLKDQTK